MSSRGGVKVSALAVLGDGRWVSRGVQECAGSSRPPSVTHQRYQASLRRRRAHALEGRKRKVKERRAGATRGAPRGCPGAPSVRLLRGLRGRTKAAAATTFLRGRAARRGLLRPGDADSLPSVLRSCAFGAAPLLRAASVRLPALGSVSALGGSMALCEGTAFFILWCLFLPLRRQARVTLASP